MVLGIFDSGTVVRINVPYEVNRRLSEITYASTRTVLVLPELFQR